MIYTYNSVVVGGIFLGEAFSFLRLQWTTVPVQVQPNGQVKVALQPYSSSSSAPIIQHVFISTIETI